MITVDDLATAVIGRLGATFQTTVTGKAWFLRADENAGVPYAVFAIERAGDAEFSSDGSYLQGFTLRMAGYTDQGAGTDPNAVQLAMAVALNANPTSWDALRDGAIVHVLPQGFDGKFSPTLRQARDVFVGGGQWSILVSGSRVAT